MFTWFQLLGEYIMNIYKILFATEAVINFDGSNSSPKVWTGTTIEKVSGTKKRNGERNVLQIIKSIGYRSET